MMLNYNKFSKKVNENILSMVTNYISFVYDLLSNKFKDKATAYYAIYLSKKNQLPRDSKGNLKVMIKVPREWYNDPVYDEIDEELAKDDIVIPNEIIDTVNESIIVDNFDDVNEAIKDVAVDKNADIFNVDVKMLKYYITLGYYMTLGHEQGHFGSGEEEYKGGPLFIWGVPGIGKTQITNQIAKELGIQIQVWSLATLDPTDIKGVPFIVKAVNKLTSKLFPSRTQNAIPSILPKNNWNGKNNKGGILFLDEFNRGNPYVHNAVLSLINNGKIDNYKLPNRWFIVAAGNKLSDLGNMAGTEMSAEMQNRFFHINLVPNLEDFKLHVKGNKKLNPDIIDYLSFDESNLHHMDTDPEVLNIDPAFATPRAWMAASTEHYYSVDGDWSKKLSKSELISIYRPHIGDVALMFAEFVDMKDNYNVDDIIDVYENGAMAKRELPKKLDQSWGAIIAITSYVHNKKRDITPKELKNLYDYSLKMENSELSELFASKIKYYYPYTYAKPGEKNISHPELVALRQEFIKKWAERMNVEKEKIKNFTK